MNAVFSMFEIAFVSSRKSRLEEKASKGNTSAKSILKQLEQPERTLSVVQMAMTLASIVSGAYGGIAIAGHVISILPNTEWWIEYGYTIAVITVIIGISYLTLVLGELVPKTLAMNNPEKIAISLNPYIRVIAILFFPFVWFLSISTKLFIRIFRIKTNSDPPVTEAELRFMISKGTEHGVLEEQESEIIHDVMDFADKSAYSMMTPNKDLVWLNVNDDEKEILQTVINAPYSVFPVCNESIDKVIGIVDVKDIFRQLNQQTALNLKAIMTVPYFIPETVMAMQLLDDFKRERIKMGIVVNEYGETHGVVTIQDIIDDVLGDFPDKTQDHQPHFIEREDGSLLFDGDYQLDDLLDYLHLDGENEEVKEIKQNVSTLGGFIMYILKKVPTEGEHIIFDNYRFEVLDMDGNRVDKLLINKMTDLQ